MSADSRMDRAVRYVRSHGTTLGSRGLVRKRSVDQMGEMDDWEPIMILNYVLQYVHTRHSANEHCASNNENHQTVAFAPLPAMQSS